eukprot:753223-Pelagomonas_calceolata.AAC.2
MLLQTAFRAPSMKGADHPCSSWLFDTSQDRKSPVVGAAEKVFGVIEAQAQQLPRSGQLPRLQELSHLCVHTTNRCKRCAQVLPAAS